MDPVDDKYDACEDYYMGPVRTNIGPIRTNVRSIGIISRDVLMTNCPVEDHMEP